MRLTTGRSKLKQGHEDLMVRWQEVASGWDDATRRAFEEEHLEPVVPDLQSALRAIDRLSAVISQMHQECG
ncbi:MAG: hypothetical protein K1X57_17275 [Gemmataceae bacterium]|nr:hypothetical protein [Gemmataceae bacterium]